MEKIKDARSGFYLRIKTLYDIEKQLVSALPKMAKAATSPDLSAGLLAHLEETKEQSRRLERIFNIIEATPRKYKGETIRGLVADGAEKMSADTSNALRDVMIAGAGREVEHFEMACYRNAIAEAKSLGLDEVVELLEVTLEEEVIADETMEKAFQDNLKLVAEEGDSQVE